jgi:hypothetical protein
MPRPTRNKVRLNLDVPPDIKALILMLMETSGADSMTEVVRNAVRVYDFVLNNNNGEFYVPDNNGTLTRVKVL